MWPNGLYNSVESLIICFCGIIYFQKDFVFAQSNISIPNVIFMFALVYCIISQGRSQGGGVGGVSTPPSSRVGENFGPF